MLKVNESFFRIWSPQMAYVLGFFAADGSMYINPRGSKYISFYSNDRDILEKIRKALDSKHKITLKSRYNKNWKPSFYLQIGSKEMYKDLIGLGLMPNKRLRLEFPSMPHKYARHFIRGYFDGDGSIIYGFYIRKDRHNRRTPYLLTCFAAANDKFLKSISRILTRDAGMRKGYIDKEREHLSYSKLDSFKLLRYIYRGIPGKQSIYLPRKYKKFQRALKIVGAVA